MKNDVHSYVKLSDGKCFVVKFNLKSLQMLRSPFRSKITAETLLFPRFRRRSEVVTRANYGVETTLVLSGWIFEWQPSSGNSNSKTREELQTLTDDVYRKKNQKMSIRNAVSTNSMLVLYIVIVSLSTRKKFDTEVIREVMGCTLISRVTGVTAASIMMVNSCPAKSSA